ncbi:MAG: protein translocase subunit SecD [Cellulomonadaceae bacterium]|jgi:preprotein translocase subunit SecD|nr:protein translocase subunit SecD [Cellulomonadaceae bacterium]
MAEVKSRPVRTIVTFLILTLVAPLGALILGITLDGRNETNLDGASMAPRLALDLEGGTQIILTPKATDGSAISSTQIDEAINVIRQRVDSSGVAEAEITSQGGQNIVVGIPGKATQDTINLISQAAVLNFRPVLATDWGVPQDATADGDTGDGTADESTDPAAEPSPEPSPDATPEPSPDPTDDSADGDAAGDGSADATADNADATPERTAPGNPDNHSDTAQITPGIAAYFQALNCAAEGALTPTDAAPDEDVLVTCSTDGMSKYILGPVDVHGGSISAASSGLLTGPTGATTNDWGVNLSFDATGTDAFAEASQRLYDIGQGQAGNAFAVTIDDLVVTAPSISTPIRDGHAQISGNFTRQSAATLANQLNYGSLPMQFEIQSQQEISATLGSVQLRHGLIAGLIGLALVVVYSMFQYRTLGLLTVASLVVAGLITYVVIALLGWTMGYHLSLPGVAGLIVAIGFTADSFIVYFERIRDELRNGRSLGVAVERGWKRARRTILAAKFINLVAAGILYVTAVGGVQGFAFTLGITTIIDVIVVLWFTHPVMEIISKKPFFRDGNAASGLSRQRLQLTAFPDKSAVEEAI